MQVELVGGPLDGAVRSDPHRGPFLYVDTQLRCWRKVGPGRTLYRLSGDRLFYVEQWWTQCRGCGSFHARVSEHCSLCGSALILGAQGRASG